MSGIGRVAASRARALVGTRFRPQGRRPEYGLDCLGLAAAVAGLPEELLPSGYALRSEAPDELLIETFGGRLRRIEPAQIGEGDIVLAQTGARQHHLLVLTREGFVHADARSGRVVEQPGSLPWQAVAAWSIVGED